ncbi:MAG: dienelactone hydrolase family protein [Candidatus Rokubacteria bacterium]|nr:dienelactone hydrolase family protein [Candidatus Rokubacteria bacterium]
MQFRVSPAVVVSGFLALPHGTGPFPAVVLLAACDGLAYSPISAWRARLVGRGYATVAVDSLGGRRLTTACGTPSPLWFAEQVPDAYAALNLLATHPKVDPARVVLMGWAEGGSTVLQAAGTSVAMAPGGPHAPRFRAFIAVYPACGVFFERRGPSWEVASSLTKLSAPVRLHVGEQADVGSTNSCRALVESLRTRGNDLELTVYPGAREGFDRSPANRIRAATEATGSPAGSAPAPSASQKAPASSWNAEATAAAQANVERQLEELLRTSR